MEKVMNNSRNREMQTKGNSVERCKSILKQRGTYQAVKNTKNPENDLGSGRGKSVRFESKKSVAFFRIGSTVSLFKDNLNKQLSLKKDQGKASIFKR